MEHGLLSRAVEYINRQRQKKRWQKAVTAMAAVVVFCTTYALILPAITLENQVYCGQEEHIHDEACYGQALTCTLTQAEVHVHTDGCYQTDSTLVCTQTEAPGHTHGPECRQTETLLTCTSTEEGHQHGDGCYTTAVTYICGLEETAGHTHEADCWQHTKTLICTESTEIPADGHVHDETCYGTSQEPTCGCQEHEHEDACHVNDKADLETAAQWERTFQDVELTGQFPADVLAIAETQLGYTESAENYIKNDEGRKLGYSRYGAWYGDPYGDWCAMFVSFCLHYADVPADTFPLEASCQRWIDDLDDLDLYQEAGDYVPKPGDLIFFNWDEEADSDHVGLVEELVLDEEGNCKEIKTIEGNSSNRVQRVTYDWDDPSIMGYGELPEREEETEDPPGPLEPEGPVNPENEAIVEEEPSDDGFVSWETLLEAVKEADISNGPVVYIFGRNKEDVPAVFSAGEQRPQGVMMFAAQPRNTAGTIDLKQYLEDNQIPYTFVITDTNDVEAPKDENGYVLTANTAYQLTMSMYFDHGIRDGTYTYQLPDGLHVHGGNGRLEIKNTHTGELVDVGTWAVDEAGLITLHFLPEINNMAEITIGVSVGTEFDQDAGPIDFDGKIHVTVNPPPAEDESTQLNKWLEQPEGETEKLHWKIHIVGREQSHIPGSTITDTILTADGEHFYDDADKAAGLTFGANSADGQWHSWTVPAREVDWDTGSWSYHIPERVRCDYCGEIELGSAGWEYFITYTSSAVQTGVSGSLTYGNRVVVDGKIYDAWFDVAHGESEVEINKTGVFQGDATGGKFVWELTAVIPGNDTSPQMLRWRIKDELKVLGVNVAVPNEIPLGEITATYQGTRYSVPGIYQADGDDLFAYEFYEATGEILLLSRCNCHSAESCTEWYPTASGNERCGTHSWNYGYTHCECWDLEGTTIFSFEYETDEPFLVDEYGGTGNVLQNYANLQYKEPGGNNWFVKADETVAEVTIPGLFKKDLTVDGDPSAYNDYTASYEITVNEGKLDLGTNPVVIRDEMTVTLAYISGSLEIVTENAQGQTALLREGEDYTVSYDGTGTVGSIVNNEPIHLLEITINDPQPVMYTMYYDAALVIPQGQVGGVTISNAAYVTLWGQDFFDDTEKKTYPDISISGTAYQVNIRKTGDQGIPLKGAEFGLYNREGRLIISGETDANGRLRFETDVTSGIILRGHTPYYIQEIKTLPGYYLDGTKHWFCFCNQGPGCAQCAKNGAGSCPGLIGVLSGHTYNLTNQLGSYQLPETGGPGAHWYILGGILLITGGTLWYRKQDDGKEGTRTS